jgi:hypothetical protein
MTPCTLIAHWLSSTPAPMGYVSPTPEQRNAIVQQRTARLKRLKSLAAATQKAIEREIRCLAKAQADEPSAMARLAPSEQSQIGER